MLVNKMVENFAKVKLNTCGPDGVNPALTREIKREEDKIKIVKEALEMETIFDTRIVLPKK